MTFIGTPKLMRWSRGMCYQQNEDSSELDDAVQSARRPEAFASS
jgi:hypothetical protein